MVVLQAFRSSSVARKGCSAYMKSLGSERHARLHLSERFLCRSGCEVVCGLQASKRLSSCGAEIRPTEAAQVPESRSPTQI